jgi:type I restriction enzyme S subunit
LTDIIKKKRQQLEDLDKLAQSIFYDMFGDPITNEKGWEMKKLKDVAEIVGGSTPKTNVEEYWNGQNPWVAPAELHQNHYISSTERGISNEAAKGLPLLPVGTVLLSSRAPIGKVSITTIPMYCNQGFKNVVCSNALNNEYVYHLLLNKTEYLNSLGTGATFKEISKKTTENIAIAVPPIDLQEAFAAQSRAIEKQKELVKRSIVDAEMLFNSRMDYWFN